MLHSTAFSQATCPAGEMRLGVCLPFRPACTSRARRTITLPRRWLSNALKFDKVTYQYEYLKPILTEASFMVKEGSKMALVGQNGSGKSTIFKLVNGVIRPDEGHVHVPRDITVATSLQAIPPAQRGLRVHEFFQRYYPDEDEVFLEEMMNEALHAVALHAPRDRIVSSFSGGQQARLLLASALIQHPDLLLLDEPTNNLDATGIRHLTDYLAKSKKTCLVISHDAAFLDAFTTGILYLDIFTKKVNEHSGTYHETIETIAAQIAKTKKEIGRRKRLVHQKRSLAKDIVQKSKAKRKKNKNSVRIDASADRILQQLPELKNSDVAIDPFTIPTGLTPDELAKAGNLLGFNEVSIYDRAIGEGGGFRIAALPTAVTLKAKDRLILTGPNGCGKTTLLEQLVKGRRCFLKEGVTVGYYRQDFSELDYETTVRDSLLSACAEEEFKEEEESKEQEGEKDGENPWDIIREPGMRKKQYQQRVWQAEVLRMRAEEERKKDKKRVFREAKAETRGRLDKNENGLRRFENVAAGFLISEELLQTPIGQLSEGQKGLLVLARLVLQKPDVLVMDEPTNHINLLHLPVIARALDAYEGAVVLVSHDTEFVARMLSLDKEKVVEEEGESSDDDSEDATDNEGSDRDDSTEDDEGEGSGDSGSKTDGDSREKKSGESSKKKTGEGNGKAGRESSSRTEVGITNGKKPRWTNLTLDMATLL